MPGAPRRHIRDRPLCAMAPPAPPSWPKCTRAGIGGRRRRPSGRSCKTGMPSMPKASQAFEQAWGAAAVPNASKAPGRARNRSRSIRPVRQLAGALQGHAARLVPAQSARGVSTAAEPSGFESEPAGIRRLGDAGRRAGRHGCQGHALRRRRFESSSVGAAQHVADHRRVFMTSTWLTIGRLGRRSLPARMKK